MSSILARLGTREQNFGLYSESVETPGPFISPKISQNYRFKKMERSWWKWFKLGRVFAIISAGFDSRSGAAKDNFSIKRRTNRGHEVVSKIRRSVIWQTEDGSCITVHINTYGMRDLRKPNKDFPLISKGSLPATEKGLNPPATKTGQFESRRRQQRMQQQPKPTDVQIARTRSHHPTALALGRPRSRFEPLLSREPDLAMLVRS